MNQGPFSLTTPASTLGSKYFIRSMANVVEPATTEAMTCGLRLAMSWMRNCGFELTASAIIFAPSGPSSSTISTIISGLSLSAAARSAGSRLSSRAERFPLELMILPSSGPMGLLAGTSIIPPSTMAAITRVMTMMLITVWKGALKSIFFAFPFSSPMATRDRVVLRLLSK